MRYLIFVFFTLLTYNAWASNGQENIRHDTSEVIKMNGPGFDMRVTDPGQTIEIALKALAISEKSLTNVA